MKTKEFFIDLLLVVAVIVFIFYIHHYKPESPVVNENATVVFSAVPHSVDNIESLNVSFNTSEVENLSEQVRILNETVWNLTHPVKPKHSSPAPVPSNNIVSTIPPFPVPDPLQNLNPSPCNPFERMCPA